jgi:hypothetical protein
MHSEFHVYLMVSPPAAAYVIALGVKIFLLFSLSQVFRSARFGAK